MNDFEMRIARLERASRRWKVATLALVLVGCGVAAQEPRPKDKPRPKIIQADQFIVGGEVGPIRATIGTSGVNGEVVGVHLYDSKGEVRLGLQIDGKDEATIRLTGPGMSGINLIGPKDATPLMGIQDATGKVVWTEP